MTAKAMTATMMTFRRPYPQRSTPLYLEGDDAPPVLLRTDLSAAAKPLSR